MVNDFRRSGNQWFFTWMKNRPYFQRTVKGKSTESFIHSMKEALWTQVLPADQGKGVKCSVSGSSFTAISSRQQYLNKTANPYMNNQTVQWFNAACAILTRHNAGNIRAFGGGLKLAGKEENGEEMDRAAK